MDPLTLDRYVRLTVQKKEEADALDRTTKALALLEAQLVEEFANDGYQSVKTSGGATVYLRRTLWANAAPGEDGNGDYPRACAALVAAGLGVMVQERFNVQTLSAYVRELDERGEDLPAAFEGAIKVSEKITIGVRGAR